MKNRLAAAISAIGALALSAGAAHGAILSFFQITNNGTTDVSGQLVLEITDLGGGVISFDLSNTGPEASAVRMFNIQDNDGLFADVVGITNGPGVNFVENAPPSNLPGGNDAGFDSAWGSSATAPPPVNGVNVDEWVVLRLSLAGGNTFADVEASIASGALRGGVHVIGLGEDGEFSEAYITNPPIPTPGTIAIGALACIAGIRRSR